MVYFVSKQFNKTNLDYHKILVMKKISLESNFYLVKFFFVRHDYTFFPKFNLKPPQDMDWLVELFLCTYFTYSC